MLILAKFIKIIDENSENNKLYANSLYNCNSYPYVFKSSKKNIISPS